MDTDKRVLVAFALSFLILILWRVMFVKPQPEPAKSANATHAVKPQAESRTAAPAVAVPSAASNIAPAPKIPVAQASRAQDVTVENALYKVTFSTQGAVVKSWILKKYRDSNGKSLDLVDPAASQQVGYPMSISTADAALSQKLNQALFVVKPPSQALSAPATLDFVYSDGTVQAEKKFSFDSSYMVRASVSVAQDQRYVPVRVAWRGGFGDHSQGEASEIAHSKVVYEADGDLNTIAQHKIEAEKVVQGPLSFGGLEDAYFAGIFFAGTADDTFTAGQTAWTPQNWKEKKPPQALYAELGSSQPKPLDFQLFVAPKDLDVLSSTTPSLAGLVDFGWFSMIAKPLFLAMRYVYDHWVHNYGWAIVILTFIINMALFPLKLKSIRSAQEMQRIAPHVKAIQDRYKQYKFNDPRKQRMNQEIMSLYSEHGVSPLGGCWPMLLQLPILYGLYEMLEVPIEFRHAPWILWIKDLSMPDNSHIMGLPIPILPTIMIVTMFILQKMTPMATADPSQKRMMMIMPLVFGLMFFRFASGLVLYFLAANIVGIAQQMFINRVMTPNPPPLAPQKTAGAKA